MIRLLQKIRVSRAVRMAKRTSEVFLPRRAIKTMELMIIRGMINSRSLATGWLIRISRRT